MDESSRTTGGLKKIRDWISKMRMTGELKKTGNWIPKMKEIDQMVS